MQFGSALEQNLGDHDVGAGRQGAVTKTDVLLVEQLADLTAGRRFVGRQRHVAGEMQAARRAQGIEPALVFVQFVQDQSELPQARGMVFPGPRRHGNGVGEHGAGLAHPPDQQQGLRPGGRVVIGRVRLGFTPVEAVQHLPGERPRAFRLAGQQRQGRGVDQGIGGPAQPA